MPSHQYRGKSPHRRKRSSGFSQASTRRQVFLYDQHGREWCASVSNKSGMTVGQITPNFRAPWVPDQQYLRVNPDNTSELFIDYRALLVRRSALLEEYHKTAVHYAREKRLDLPTKGIYSDQITSGAPGKPPKPVEPVVAAIQGNPYILGLTETVDPRLEPFVTVRRDEAILAEYNFGPESNTSANSFAAMKAANAPSAATAGATNTDATDDPTGAFGDIDAALASIAGSRGSDDDPTTDPEDLDELIEELDDEFDADAMGGRIVAPRNTDRAGAQAPRRPTASATRRKHGKSRSVSGKHAKDARASQRAGRRTLADGAEPVIGDGSFD